jgi:hypothetical protein
MNKAFRLADIAEVRPGYLARKPTKPRADGTHYLLQIRDFNRDRSAVDLTAILRFVPDPISSLQPLVAGDVVFLARGARNFAYAPADLPACTLAAGYFFIIHPNDQVNPAYLAWFLNQPATLRVLSRAATSGAHMPVVRRADIESLEIPVPSFPVQSAIVELDNLRRQEDDLLCDLVNKRNSLIAAACQSAATRDIISGAPLAPPAEPGDKP